MDITFTVRLLVIVYARPLPVSEDGEAEILPSPCDGGDAEPQVQETVAESPQVDQEVRSPTAIVCDVVHPLAAEAVQKTADVQEEPLKEDSCEVLQQPSSDDPLPPQSDVVNSLGGDEEMPTKADGGEVQTTALDEEAPKQSVSPKSEDLPPRPQEAGESEVPRDVVRKSSSSESSSSEDSSSIATDAPQEARPLHTSQPSHMINLPFHRRTRRKRSDSCASTPREPSTYSRRSSL